jgi:hypothetical protein
MRRRGSILCWVLVCLVTAGTDRARADTASVDASLAGWLDQWQLSYQPPPGPALAGEACAPTTVVNAMVYLQNQYPEIYGTLLAGTNQTQWAETAVLLAGPNYMNTDPVVGTVPVVNLTSGLRSFLSDRGFASTRVSGMLPQGTNGGLVQELIGPLPSDYVEGLPTLDYFATTLRGGSPVTLQILYEGQSVGHNVLLTGVDWTGSGAGATGTMQFIDPLDPANYDTNGFPVSLKVTTGTVSILPSISLTNTNNGVVDTLSNVLALDYQQYLGSLPYNGTNYGPTTALIGGATIMQVPEPRVVPLVLLAAASLAWFRVWRRNRTEG